MRAILLIPAVAMLLTAVYVARGDDEEGPRFINQAITLLGMGAISIVVVTGSALLAIGALLIVGPFVFANLWRSD